VRRSLSVTAIDISIQSFNGSSNTSLTPPPFLHLTGRSHVPSQAARFRARGRSGSHARRRMTHRSLPKGRYSLGDARGAVLRRTQATVSACTCRHSTDSQEAALSVSRACKVREEVSNPIPYKLGIIRTQKGVRVCLSPTGSLRFALTQSQPNETYRYTIQCADQGVPWR
jgi:hypothetical protein